MFLSSNDERNQHLAHDIIDAYHEGRKILVLTERTDQLERLRAGIAESVDSCFVLHGRMPKKQREATIAALMALEGSASRVLLATGRLVGEGFDHPPLDTLVLALPVSWKGTLQQYAGRLHRNHAHKHDVRIYDYVEQDHPPLARMWDKRRRGYLSMGYKVVTE